jgi:hypothetical protein
LSLFHAKHDSHRLMPIHIYNGLTGEPVALIPRPGKTPSGTEVALVPRHVVRRLRGRWPGVEITVRGDSHYGRHEAMAFRSQNDRKAIANQFRLLVHTAAYCTRNKLSGQTLSRRWYDDGPGSFERVSTSPAGKGIACRHILSSRQRNAASEQFR